MIRNQAHYSQLHVPGNVPLVLEFPSAAPLEAHIGAPEPFFPGTNSAPGVIGYFPHEICVASFALQVAISGEDERIMACCFPMVLAILVIVLPCW